MPYVLLDHPSLITVLFVSNPQGISDIFLAKEFGKADMKQLEHSKVMGQSLLTKGGSIGRYIGNNQTSPRSFISAQRVAMEPAFKYSKLKKLNPVFCELTEVLLRCWETIDSETITVTKWFEVV